MKFANMHLHSVCSDGIFTPGELCEIIKNIGYGAIVLSDHAAGIDTSYIIDLDDASVRHGASREEYYNLKNRIFG